jgi:hypothetical protein
MTLIALPALRGDRVLGFLAALGVVRLLAEELGDDEAAMSWPAGGRGGPLLRTSIADEVDQLAAGLFGVVEQMRGDGQLIPATTLLPLRNTKSDPMNSLSFDDGRGLSTTVNGDAAAERWLASFTGTTSLPREASLKRTRWWAVGPGPVTIAGTLDKAMEPISTIDDMRSALVAWRRHDWVGGYLDAAADVGKERTNGNSAKAAVIGATWLALMATRWFPERALSEERSETVGWSVSKGKAVFRYPVWSGQLSAHSIRTLLDHPALAAQPDQGTLSCLGISEIWQATRLQSGKNNAAVTHSIREWSKA